MPVVITRTDLSILGRRLSIAVVVMLLGVFTLAAYADPVAPAGLNLVVTTLHNQGAGSLVEAITAANAAPTDDTITFAVTGTIVQNDTAPLPAIANNGALTIDGGTLGLVKVSGQYTARVFMVLPGAHLTLNNLAIENGRVDNGDGGAINNQGTVTLTRVSMLSNRIISGKGAGIYNSGILTMDQSAILGATGYSVEGGGIYNIGTLTITNSSILNTADAGLVVRGGTVTVVNATIVGSDYDGIRHHAGQVIVHNSILANKKNGSDCIGTVTVRYSLIESGGCGTVNGVNGNITGVDPALSTTVTTIPYHYYVLPSSPAVNSGNNALIPAGATLDQLGDPRIQGGTVDMGAEEMDPTFAMVSINAY